MLTTRSLEMKDIKDTEWKGLRKEISTPDAANQVFAQQGLQTCGCQSSD